jgi:hypothetical protein
MVGIQGKFAEIVALLEMSNCERIGLDYAYRSEKDQKLRKEFRQDLYSSMFDYYSTFVIYLRIIKKYQKQWNISDEKIISNEKNLRKLIYQLDLFDEIFPE